MLLRPNAPLGCCIAWLFKKQRIRGAGCRNGGEVVGSVRSFWVGLVDEVEMVSFLVMCYLTIYLFFVCVSVFSDAQVSK